MRGTFVRLVMLLLLSLGLPSCAEEPRLAGPPHVVFIVIDTLRADHLPSYG